MSNAYYNRSRMRGLSLVEVMVAITISLILLGGAITLFVNNKVAYRVNEDLSRLQENARFAIDFMTHDLRLAGYFGCRQDDASTNVPPAGDGDLLDFLDDNNLVIAIEGVDDAMAAMEWSPSGNSDTIEICDPAALDPDVSCIREGTDGVTVRHLDGRDQRDVLDEVGNILQIDDATGFQQNEVVGVYHCDKTNIFQVTNDVTANELEHDPYGGDPSFKYDDADLRPRVAKYIAARYFVRDTANGPVLVRETLDEDLESRESLDEVVLVEGVENMQILYGVDQDNDDGVDCYLPAGAPNTPCGAGNVALQNETDWLSVKSVRIGLLMRTLQPTQDEDTTTYQINDVSFNPDPGDTFKRRVFNTTVMLRNRNLKALELPPAGGGGGGGAP